MDTPASLEQHAPKYQDNAWQQYTLQELGTFVHLLVKRSGHRTDVAKADKDLRDAQNYLCMMQAHIDDAQKKLVTSSNG